MSRVPRSVARVLAVMSLAAAGCVCRIAGPGDPPAAAVRPVADAEPPGLADTAWQLVEIASMDDTVSRPDDPARYTLVFGADGMVQVQADCNRGTGSWSSEAPGQLAFGPMAATQALCPPGSLHDLYLAQFPHVRSYVVEDGHLFLATEADGSIVEFAPRAAGPAATVLGEAVTTDDPVELQAAVVTALFDRYAEERGIRAEEAEIEAYLEALDRVARQDRAERAARIADLDRQLQAGTLPGPERERLASRRAQEAEALDGLETAGDLSPEEAREVADMRRGLAESVVRQWKINRALYNDHGGRIIFQQGGPEPLDAYRAFLEQQQRDGAFAIHRPELEAPFWRYFADDAMHTFLPPGSEAAARAFTVPPWELPADGE